ncbi:MAG: type II toxin-antitoxin system prevent-host-death family antitoxin [Alphaproteobacteria bacterium]|nr:type II toxin-antitoxin system prevent-host-death family antitoxin [Alphaproteobacteria bacterium]MBU2378976.1 type II toxin-antitoxin system prevent-host-death family antitoxin [Alphaproteobacteria bacterium]
MSEYSIAHAKDQLPRLIDRMLNGEAVVITRRGRPVARVVPIDPVTADLPHKIDLEWLRSIREAAKTETSGVTDTVKAMREDYRY